ncbi:hypothetical protein [Leucobacter luti]|uniref:hypothetical protein n=1 Tax=Leucobacter luti TaxID=340320 RepID=UPI001049FD62|nr:hypothetical protein [Leucobacter luti]MCW2289029.1 hypothetical protein [Leucobacter luti]
MHEGIAVSTLVQQAAAFQEAGANTRIVSAPGRVDGAACDALASNYGVVSAAIKETPEQLKARVMMAAPLRQYVATPGIVNVLTAQDSSGEPVNKPGAIVSEQVLEQFGRETTTIEATYGPVDVAGSFRYPDDGRRDGLGFSAIYPEVTSDTPYDECWIRSWPEVPDISAMLNSVVIPSEGTDLEPSEFTQWNTTLGTTFDGDLQFENRASRFNAYLAFGVGLLVGLSSVRRRKLELASARHAGVTMGSLVGIHIIQSTVWVFSGSVLGFLSIAAISHPLGGSGTALNLLGVRILVLGALGALSGVCIGVCSIHERALFGYFQARD